MAEKKPNNLKGNIIQKGSIAGLILFLIGSCVGLLLTLFGYYSFATSEQFISPPIDTTIR